jgi:N-formylglutamate amidohydrolase
MSSDAPYLVTDPASEPSPVVVSVPHAGTHVPDEDRALVGADERTIRRDADLHVDRLWHNAPAHGAALLRATWSRYVLDLNRAPDDVDREVCPGIERPARTNPRALIWRLSTEGLKVLPRPLEPEELADRVTRIHRPYHERLRQLLEERRQRFGWAILVDGHSMPSVGRATHSDPGVRRADVVPGDVLGRSCSGRLSALVKDHFVSAGLKVKPNEPYMGGYITRHHGRPADDVHAIQIEVNRDLYMEEESCAFLEDRAAVLSRQLEALLDKLATLDLS